MKAYLDGILLTDEAADLNAVRITSTGRAKADYVERVVFSGWAYDLLKTQLIDNPKGYLNSVTFHVEQSCCGGGRVFTGAVRGDKIDWDSDGCIITAAIIQEDEKTGYYAKLATELISDHLPANNPVVFCYSGKGFISAFATILTNILLIDLMFGLLPVIAAVSFIVSIFDRGFFNEAMAFMQNMAEDLSQNALKAIGQYIPAPLVREMLAETLSACGLVFESPILTDPASPYFDLAYLSIQSEPYDVTSRAVKPSNIPVRNAEQFLEELGTVFNAKWDIYGGKLVFDRRDRLPDAGVFDVSSETDLKTAFSWNADQKNAYFDLRYMQDGDEKAGNTIAYSLFDFIAEWNPSGSQNQKGAFEVVLPFAPYTVDEPFNGQTGADLIKIFAAKNGLPSIESLEISGQYMYVPKLIPIRAAGQIWQAYDDGRMRGEALYNAFWFIQDPNYSGFRGLSFDVSFEASCAFLQAAQNLSRIILQVGNGTALGYVSNVEIDHNTNRARIKGEI